MARIATGTGDQGTTGLADGARLAKSHPRIEAYGAVDELNAVLGLAVPKVSSDLGAGLQRLQHELFALGADLARAKGGPRITKAHVARLDAELDALEASLPPLRAFILPGGSDGAAALHHARTVCRRAERQVVALREAGEAVDEAALVYLNRLGDLLFLKARQANVEAGRGDVEARF